MKIEMDFLNVESQVDCAKQLKKQGVKFSELIREAYIQGMVDKTIESMEQLTGVAQAWDSMNFTGDSILVEVIPWSEWANDYDED